MVIEEKNQCLRADMQQRVILAAMRWVDADSAVNEQEGARLVRQTMEILLTALTLRPACVLGVFYVTEKENRLRLTVDCRRANALCALPPYVELLSGDGLSRIEVDSSGLAHGESPGLHHWCADVADCF